MADLLDVRDFARDDLVEELGDTVQAKYVAEYLTDQHAGTVARESQYVDRHYLEDYAEYHCRSFLTPAAQCERLHFFSAKPSEVTALISKAYRTGEDRARAIGDLNGKYLGFLVKRPLPTAAIGRTVLATYDAAGGRRFDTSRRYDVNLFGLDLSVTGLAFQQQDRVTAACSAVSLWSALQSVAQRSGMRTPTPAEVVRAASLGLPAHTGMAWDEMVRAIKNLGFVPDLFDPSGRRELFRAQLVAALRSGLPVVLMLNHVDRGAHAITVTGYKEPQELGTARFAADGPSFATRWASLQVVYVHDDNLGSHAHFELSDVEDEGVMSSPKLNVLRGDPSRSEQYWLRDECEVTAALVAKPPKLRKTIANLFEEVIPIDRFISTLVPEALIRFECRFAAGTGFRAEIMAEAARFRSEDVESFQRSVHLPRHVGVVSASIESAQLDFIIDVTDNALALPWLAIVACGVPGNSRLASALAKAMPVAGTKTNRWPTPRLLTEHHAPVQ